MRSAIEAGWLWRDLPRGHRVVQSDLAALLSRLPSWGSRRLALVEVLPVVAEEAVRRGALAAAAAILIGFLLLSGVGSSRDSHG